MGETSKVKILVLSHVSEYLGGAERSILDVLDVWSKSYGVDPVFILRKPLGTYTKQLEKRGWKYYPVDYTYWSDSNLPKDNYRIAVNARRNTKAILRIEEIIKEVKPGVVVTNSIVAPWAAIAAYYQRVPHVWFAREYGDLDHGREFETSQQETFEDIGMLSDLVIANSKTLASHIKQYVPKEKTTVLYNPFNISDLENKISEDIKGPFKHKDSLKLVLTAGSITESKGHQEAISAVAKLKNKGHSVELALIGKPGEKSFMSELNTIIKNNKMGDRIHFLGYISNPLPIVNKADVCIMSSKKEAFGRVTFEYMVAGKAVVGAGTGATPELIKDGVSGIIYDPSSQESLAVAIEVYAKDKNKIEAHGKAAKKRAKEMMEGNLNVHSAFLKMKKAIGKSEANERHILNYTHRWLYYPSAALDFINENREDSYRRLLIKISKEKIRPYYARALEVRNRYLRREG